MILRVWRGAVRAENADRYLRHQADTGVGEYFDTVGNLGAIVLRRARGDLVEVVNLSLWGSIDDVKRFAGEDPEQARFYPGDDDLLVEKDDRAEHYEVVGAQLDEQLLRFAPEG